MSGITFIFMSILICVGGSVIKTEVDSTDPVLTDSKIPTHYSSQLKFVALVEGKAFFSTVTRMDWNTASKYCESVGLKLASITSEAQFSALNSIYPIDIHTFFWTSGTDTLLPHQFHWSGSKTNITQSFLPYKNRQNITFQTCLGFENRANGGSVLFPYSCSATLGATLCELISCAAT